MLLADFLDNVVSTAVGVVLALFFIAMLLSVFGEMILEPIFEFIGDARRAWKEHMQDED